ncbi:hypothetical protein ACFRCQ_07525 [Cytobacillus firmus]|uniref:hypothetical protein n=1 Tax=Cytobacillus firmus TaxID=1399 RepID=UPI0036CDA507
MKSFEGKLKIKAISFKIQDGNNTFCIQVSSTNEPSQEAIGRANRKINEIMNTIYKRK